MTKKITFLFTVNAVRFLGCCSHDMFQAWPDLKTSDSYTDYFLNQAINYLFK